MVAPIFSNYSYSIRQKISNSLLLFRCRHVNCKTIGIFFIRNPKSKRYHNKIIALLMSISGFATLLRIWWNEQSGNCFQRIFVSAVRNFAMASLKQQNSSKPSFKKTWKYYKMPNKDFSRVTFNFMSSRTIHIDNGLKPRWTIQRLVSNRATNTVTLIMQYM